MKILKIMMVLCFFCQIEIAIADELDLKSNDSSNIVESATIEVQSSDPEIIIPEVLNRKDTIIDYKDTFKVFLQYVDNKENEGSFKKVDSLNITQNAGDSLPIKYPSYYKNSIAIKIIAGIGITFAIGGIVSLIVIKQMKSFLPEDNNIPPPPPPPSYLEYKFVK